MIKSASIAISLAILVSGCVEALTPREQCLKTAKAPLGTLSLAIYYKEQDIARGYVTHRQSVPYTYIGTCYDYSYGTYSCEKNGSRVQETPVPINAVEERRKLAVLKSGVSAYKRLQKKDVLQCQSQFPGE